MPVTPEPAAQVASSAEPVSAPPALDGPKGESALVVEHLTKRFGNRIAFDDVSFEVGYGEVFVALMSFNVIAPTLGLALGLAAALLIVDVLGWRAVAPMFDRERLVTGTRR
jgi:hypothetical protein